MRSSIALLLLFAFGCTTLRAPAGSVDAAPSAQSSIVAEPQVQIWLESSDAVPQVAADDAQQAARAVLAEALAQRRIWTADLDARDPILVVRERAVARTTARRQAQLAAKIGIGVGFVVVAVAAVFAILKSRGNDASGGGSSAPATASRAAGAAKPVMAGARPPTAPATAGAVGRIGRSAAPRAVPLAPISPVKVAPSVSHVGPAPAYVGRYRPWIGWQIGVFLDLTPRPFALYAEPPAGENGEEGLPDAYAEPPAPATPPLTLPPMGAPDVEHRGFFAGDEIVLQAALLDRATGQVLWVNEVKSDGDPRDREDVARLLAEAFDGVSWASRP